jgi:photosystem II stability/assembly factor-like uncharacterized protein
VNRLFLGLAVLVSLLLPRPALATGRLPAGRTVLFDPRDPKTVYVPTTFGVLVSRDGGESWRWICERAIGIQAGDEARWVVTPKGTLVGATSAGVAVSRDGGCTFGFAGGPGVHVLSDLALRTSGEIVGVSSVAHEGLVYDDHLVVSKDDAQSFVVEGGPIDSTLHLESIAVAESDPARLYVAGARGEGDARMAALLVSSNGGLSWVERKLELAKGETGAAVAAVDPKSADRVYVRTTALGDGRTRLLVTSDAGKTWKKILDTPSILGFVLAPDGAKVFAGSREGIASSPTGAFSFTRGSHAEIQCLAHSGTALWACSTDRGGFFVGVSRNGGASFEAKLHLDEIKGPLECSAESAVAKRCAADWPKLRAELGLPEQETQASGAPSGPAFRGRATRTGRGRSPMAAAAAITIFGLAGYSILKRLRRGR